MTNWGQENADLLWEGLFYDAQNTAIYLTSLQVATEAQSVQSHVVKKNMEFNDGHSLYKWDGHADVNVDRVGSFEWRNNFWSLLGFPSWGEAHETIASLGHVRIALDHLLNYGGYIRGYSSPFATLNNIISKCGIDHLLKKCLYYVYAWMV